MSTQQGPAATDFDGCYAPLTNRQINALKNHLDRESFTPQDVAAISYRHLLHISGLGEKSIYLIRSWLQQYGLDLHIPASKQHKVSRSDKQLAKAKEILNKYGYALLAPEEQQHH
ncbi:hypothetical protein HZU75_16540 [Chitinibacter fontanus]|uniref:Uncharacterized protein n=1 Tax=Chitinibacter fontanus TaxID=1737446 RepID=A0A7D5VBI3_9NEIS|nr:hypothetical protein [Chitinibacter fontanus]QLI82999.1 hypothetical protein HZU75_16540 [Chitinibacter fontanus]